MRRSDKEITERELLDNLLHAAGVLHLGVCQGNRPYVVPLSYGYDGAAIHFHTAPDGRLPELLQSSPAVCFQIEHEAAIIRDPAKACGWSASFYSIIGEGIVREITDPERKVASLNQVMQHYSGRMWEIRPEDAATIRAWTIEIATMTGKKSKDKSAPPPPGPAESRFGTV